MTVNIRQDLYKNILRKEIGWHDDRDNSSGIMSAMLAHEVGLLNGASSQAAAATTEAGFALMWCLFVGYYFSWPLATVFLFVMPLLLVGASLQAAQDSKGTGDNSETKNADRLAADAIANYKTIQSFGCDKEIIEEYAALLVEPTNEDVRKGYRHALNFGIS